MDSYFHSGKQSTSRSQIISDTKRHKGAQTRTEDPGTSTKFKGRKFPTSKAQRKFSNPVHSSQPKIQTQKGWPQNDAFLQKTKKKNDIIKGEKDGYETYRSFSIVSKPDGGELTPTQFPLRYVPAAAELIADSDGVVPSFPVRVESLIVFLRPRRRRTRHHLLIYSDSPKETQNLILS